MTVKKDLKKRKSKKKGKKINVKALRTAKGRAGRKEMIPIADAVARNKNIAVVSLIQTLMLMAISIVMILAKPNSKFGEKILKQNIYLMDNIFTSKLMIAIEVIIIIVMLVYLYKAIKNRKLSKFYYTGALIAAIALIFDLIQSKVVYFTVYAYGVIIGLVIVVLQLVKLYYTNEIEKVYAREAEKERELEEK